jgi:hypothetical protein
MHDIDRIDRVSRGQAKRVSPDIANRPQAKREAVFGKRLKIGHDAYPFICPQSAYSKRRTV